MKRSWQNQFGALLLITAMALIGWMWGRHPANATTETFDTTAHFDTADPNHVSMRPDAAISAKKPDVRHADRYQELVDAAMRGDADAALHLAQAREACLKMQRIKFSIQYENEQLRSMTERASSADSRRPFEQLIATAQNELTDLQRTCIGPTEIGYREINRRFARAAQLGSREAQYQFALEPHLNPMLIGTDTEQWREWRDAAPQYLESLLSEGQSRAALTLAAASDQDDCTAPVGIPDDEFACSQSQTLGMILPQDASIAYMYYLIDQYLGDAANATWVASELARLEKSLTPEEIAIARSEAQRRFSQIHSGF